MSKIFWNDYLTKKYGKIVSTYKVVSLILYNNFLLLKLQYIPVSCFLFVSYFFFQRSVFINVCRGGNISVVNLGHIRVHSELQPSNVSLEDATQMELEERLYDRFHLDYNDLHILFCDSGCTFLYMQTDCIKHIIFCMKCN